MPPEAYKPFLDPALQFGMAGILLFVLGFLAWFGVTQLIKCLNASAERHAASIQALEKNAASNYTLAATVSEIARRIENVEREQARHRETR